MWACPFSRTLLVLGGICYGLTIQAESRPLITQNVKDIHRIILKAQDRKQVSPELIQSLLTSTTAARRVIDSRLYLDLTIPVPSPNPSGELVIVYGQSSVVPSVGASTRDCQEIRDNWLMLDEVYQAVNQLAASLQKAYAGTKVCEPCIDRILAAMTDSSQKLEYLEQNLSQDGNRIMTVVWSKEQFQDFVKPTIPGGTPIGLPQARLLWEKLSYYNVDGDSHVAGPNQSLTYPGALFIASRPDLKDSIFRYETSAERACSPTLDIRFDGSASIKIGPSPFNSALTAYSAPIQLSLQLKPTDNNDGGIRLPRED